MTPLAAIAITGCLAVGAGSDQVLLRDLAPAFEAAADWPPDAVIALAPAPGVQRRFEIAELRRIAAHFGLPDPAREVCVERPTAPPDRDRILEAMRAQLPAARIELLELSRASLPDGVLEFPRSGLRAGLSGEFWNGSVRYAGNHRAPVWARVSVRVSEARVVATQDLAAGKPIDAAALRVETLDQFPSTEPSPSAVDEVAGKMLRRPVRAGTQIRSVWLEPAKAVRRGETVQIEAREGAAVVQVAGEAQSSGSIGETVLVLNPMTKKRFPATVAAPGKVTVGRSAR